jgi:hypothetical protein
MFDLIDQMVKCEDTPLGYFFLKAASLFWHIDRDIFLQLFHRTHLFVVAFLPHMSTSCTGLL